MRAVRFHYRGIDPEGGLGDWQEQWTTADVLPVQVAVDIESADGVRWPSVIVSLAQGSGNSDGSAAVKEL